MSVVPGFVGGAYQAISPTFAADTAVNVYPESRQVPGSAKQTVLVGTPGLKLNATVATSGMRGEFAQDGRSWAVVGGVLYERVMGAYVAITPIPNDGFPVSFASNGKGGDQLGILGGGILTVINLVTGAISIAVLPFPNPVMMRFIDGYGLINQRDTPIVWFSNLEDFLTWDALDFFARSGTSDNLVGIEVTRDRIVAYGSKTTTLFYNSGDSDTPFVPYPGTTIQTGLVSPWLLGVYNDAQVFVSISAKGSPKVVVMQETQPQEISTPPIDRFLEACPTLADGELTIYEQDTHVFVVITCPSSQEDICTYTFDLTEKLWHARAGWDAVLGKYTRWPARSSVSVDGKILVGSPNSGAIYELDLDTYTDNGGVIRRERTTPYVSDENQYFFVDQFQLGIQAGVGLPSGQGSAPVANLELSRDGAQTWVNCGTGSLGAIGRYLDRCKWTRLGRFMSNLAVFRVTQTDPVKTIWTGAWLRAQGGSGQL